jgi:hypothetical protein
MWAQTGYGYVVSLGGSARIDTPSQHRMIGVVADHGVRLAVDIKRTESLVMRRGVVLCKLVTQVCVTGGPADVELSLLDAVLDPVITHVHRLRPCLENGFFSMPSAVVVSVLSSAASWGCPISFSVSRMTVPVLELTNRAPYRASETEETTCLRTLDWHSRIPLEREGHWECLLLPRKK